MGTLALTDHDTLAGLREAVEAAGQVGVRLIPGVELSVDHRGSKLHLLVYFVDDEATPIGSRLAELRSGRTRRNVGIVELLNDLGYDLTMGDVAGHARGPSVGRPHIADALIERGYFSTRDEVFADLLRDGGAAYLPRPRLTAAEAIGLSRESRAVPVVAHPATITIPEDGYGELFRQLTDLGLGGIEAHHSMHHPHLREHLTDMAHRLGIAATGGSDYHGAGVRAYRIGSGTGDLRVPEAAVEELEGQR